MIAIRRRTGLAVALALSACAAPPKGPPPVVDLSSRHCAFAPDLAQARPMTMPEKSSKKTVVETITIDGASPCLIYPDGRRSLYTVFQLPQTEDAYLVSVESMMLPNGVFAPQLSLLGETGNVLRNIPNDAFMFHSSVLSVQFRNHAGERYLLLGSQGDQAGKNFSQAQASVQQYYGGNGIVIYAGQDVTRQFQFTHSGIVVVSVGPVPEPKQQ